MSEKCFDINTHNYVLKPPIEYYESKYTITIIMLLIAIYFSFYLVKWL